MTLPCEQVSMSLTTDATDDQPDDAGADDADDGHTLPSDQELAAYFRETWDADGYGNCQHLLVRLAGDGR